MIKEMLLKDLVELETNPRTISEEDFRILCESIKKFWIIEGRPFLVSNRTWKNIILWGNQRRKACLKLWIEKVPVYIFEGLTEEQEKEIIIRDNISNGEWDNEKLEMYWEQDDLNNWGLNVEFVSWEGDFDEDDTYTKKIEAPIYEIQGDKPELLDLLENEKVNDLIKRIDKSKVSDEKKEFLKRAAYRHYVFDYKKIAEYYAHEDEEMQELMEASALVIIDFDKAIEEGYVELSDNIKKLYTNEYPNE